MKKAEELVLYTPKPVRPNLDARLCVSVAEGKGQGRYIKGKTLTVAVWDKCKNPVVTWRFCGDYWICCCRIASGYSCAHSRSSARARSSVSSGLKAAP